MPAPAVAGGKVYVTDRVLAPGVKNPDDPFSKKVKIAGSERVLCLDEADGSIVWEYKYDCPYTDLSYATGPRTTPLIAGGKVYTLGAMGNLVCLDAAKGKLIWSKDLIKDYTKRQLGSGWGFAGHPLLDGDRLICLVGGKGLDRRRLQQGHRRGSMEKPYEQRARLRSADDLRERRQAPPHYLAPRRDLRPRSRDRQAILDAAVLATKKLVKAGMTIPTPRLADDLLYLSSFLRRVGDAEAPRRATARHPVEGARAQPKTRTTPWRCTAS